MISIQDDDWEGTFSASHLDCETFSTIQLRLRHHQTISMHVTSVVHHGVPGEHNDDIYVATSIGGDRAKGGRAIPGIVD
jgi:hypothetical protein